MPGSDHDRGENFTMAEAVCYAPSELARSINQLPFPGFGAAVGNLLGDGVVSAVLGNSISVSSPDSFCQIQATISDLSAPHILSACVSFPYRIPYPLHAYHAFFPCNVAL